MSLQTHSGGLKNSGEFLVLDYVGSHQSFFFFLIINEGMPQQQSSWTGQQE